MVAKKSKTKVKELIKLDIACGQNKREGFVGIDIASCKGVDIKHDLFKFPWPVKTGSVSEAFSSHFFEHIPGMLRGQFMDEVYRILVPGGQYTIVSPYWSSPRAIQDFTHTWPPICEQSFLYFNKNWRDVNKLDHYPVTCDFDFTYGYLPDPETASKPQETQAFYVKHYLNAISDIQVVLTKK